MHALHDFIARQVHAERGLSPSQHNARFIHRGQSVSWGQEQLNRSDIAETTIATCYPTPDRSLTRRSDVPQLGAQPPGWDLSL